MTTHLPLSAVPAAVTAASLLTALETLSAGLKTRFQIAEPRILVLGLNPHAGEDGHLGREEIETVLPAIGRACAAGIRAEGPVAADTAFRPDLTDRCDAVLAMYHDQGLTPIKALEFGSLVNVTLGLPIVRTSVDHGTALDLAGSGHAKADSLLAAVELGARLSG